jgi:hypothetical protein
MYAIGGSAAPTINSQGNRFSAPDERFSKEVKIENPFIMQTAEVFSLEKLNAHNVKICEFCAGDQT